MKGPYISRVRIKNFRNFKDTDVELSHKQILIGENNVGKTNFLRALQIILDPYLSDKDRLLSPSDFNDSIREPMKNGETIEITIEIRGYEQNAQLLAKFQDAVISDTPPTLRLSYKYEPLIDDQRRILKYQYSIQLGNSQSQLNSTHRQLLNIQVIKALRDVEREMKGLKRSPLFQLVDQFDLHEEELTDIANELGEAAELIQKLDEIKEIKQLIQGKFHLLSGFQQDCGIDISTVDVDPMRLLHALQVLMGEKKRPVSETSLGLCNILFISLLLLLIRDKTIPTIIKEEKWSQLVIEDNEGLLNKFYNKNLSGNYILKKELLQDPEYPALYSFMNKNSFPSQSFTILAVEEPEAHLHPVLQRLIYKEVLQNSETSVIFSTHSPNLTSVAPLNSIVHLRRENIWASQVLSTANLSLTRNEKEDVERYLDSRRSEIYFGAGVILVEGIAEEYLIPKFADILGISLDSCRIIICNIDSTNFKPYVQLLQELGIPWCLITDGDYYEIEEGERKYHRPIAEGVDKNFLGLENIQKLLIELGQLLEEGLPADKERLRATFAEKGCFIGTYTLEVDLMAVSGENEKMIVKDVFNNIRTGGRKQQENFENEVDQGQFWKALRKIESSGVGKGRFAQRLASQWTSEQIPNYIKNALNYIIEEVKPAND